jgi:hypothetical protein
MMTQAVKQGSCSAPTHSLQQQRPSWHNSSSNMVAALLVVLPALGLARVP